MSFNPQTVKAYSILEISGWQTELQENSGQVKIPKENLITLPTLQRGFVWRSYQMEALWDSILRGYPIGALLISENEERKDLLDGQQRCTTIALGFQDPFAKVTGIMNLKPENIPSIWIDLKPLKKNKYGLKYAVRVLSRSHPWGYQLSDHRKALSASDRVQALNYFRYASGNESLGFSEIDVSTRTPWDACYPVPLSMLLRVENSNFEEWQKEIFSLIGKQLEGVRTKNGEVLYDDVKEEWLREIFDAINRAKNMLLPEILVKGNVLSEEDNSESETEATLFVRLNSEGTRISGQELIYSLLKAVFPESKELVEKLGLQYVSPSKIINLFIRLVLIKRNNESHFQKDISLPDFRKQLKEEGFKEDLIKIIKPGQEHDEQSQAQQLMERAVKIITGHEWSLPQILYRDLIAGTTDLLLVLLVYLTEYEKVSTQEEVAIRRSFLHTFLFCKSKNRKKVASSLFNVLKNQQSKNWESAYKEVVERSSVIYPLMPVAHFKAVLIDHLLPEFLDSRQRHFSNYNFLQDIFTNNSDLRQKLVHRPLRKEEELTEDEAVHKEIERATQYWIEFSNSVFWNKQFLVIAQHSYFNREFKEYMEFNGIEDTNRPWDWDHIYPNSWVYRKSGISGLVKWLINTNGNFRALSFNENRSQNNHLSPFQRFHENLDVQRDSFIGSTDLPHWLELKGQDNRLTDSQNDKIDHFVRAVFFRISNIYKECYAFMDEGQELNEN